MKQIVLIAFLLSSITTFSQFEINNGNLEWLQVFETDLNQEEIVNQFRVNAAIDNFEQVSENEYRFNLYNVTPDYKGAGITKFTQAYYVTQYDLNAVGVLQIKQGKYRVILKRLELVRLKDEPILKEYAGDIEPFERYTVKKGRIKINPKTDTLYNYTFKDLFTISVSQSEW